MNKIKPYHWNTMHFKIKQEKSFKVILNSIRDLLYSHIYIKYIYIFDQLLAQFSQIIRKINSQT
jgi:hypothetical protein